MPKKPLSAAEVIKLLKEAASASTIEMVHVDTDRELAHLACVAVAAEAHGDDPVEAVARDLRVLPPHDC